LAKDKNMADATADDAFVISHVFGAPAATVFKAWTDPAQLLGWFAPGECKVTAKTVDVRAGGAFHYAMETPTGQTIWGHWAFREVAQPARMVFVATFSDEAGGLARNPWAAGWPERVLTTVTLAEHDGRTTLTLHAIPTDATPAEHATFRAGHGPMHMGWAATLDKLAHYLSKD
jgi:uncharacterized protein YndB with AHSA1/START domain